MLAKSLTHIISDLNIDASQNGLLLAVKVEALSKKQKNKIDNLLRTCMKSKTYGTVRFSAVPKGEMCSLVLSANVYNEDSSKKLVNDLFYRTLWSSRYLKLDYVAYGYLMTLKKGRRN